MIDRHRRACRGFSHAAGLVRADQWDLLTPCTAWDARALVEHVIGFHDFLLLRPMGVRANRPRQGPAERWEATATALFDALAPDGALDRETELPGGGHSSPRQMLGALTTDVLVHTWDLARATEQPADLDAELVAIAYQAALATGFPRDSGMYGAAVNANPEADAATMLIALTGRDPSWLPRARS